MKKTVVEVRNVSKSFGTVNVLRNVSFDVLDGEVACIIGPSGAGKSTALRCINRLETHSRGTLYVHGRPLGY